MIHTGTFYRIREVVLGYIPVVGILYQFINTLIIFNLDEID